MSAPARPRTPRRAWLVWGVAVTAYGVAVFHRGSLGVAGLAAQERLGASAAELSLLAVLQLVVYAAMQVPVGALLDRFGTRTMVTGGALVMGVGQAALALADTVPEAVAARALVGVGDAMTFISVLRLVPAWFAPAQAPVLTQCTGLLGQLGQVAAAYPLVALLAGPGWTPTYLGAAAVAVVVAAVVLALVRDTPEGQPERPPLRLRSLPQQVASAWRTPMTRLGFWTHTVTQFSGMVFILLWGYPFLVDGQGLDPGTAGVLISVLVVTSVALGPLLGGLTGRWPLRRSALVLAITLATAGAWAAVLLWPGPAPLPLLVVLVLVLATNGPGSIIGFDYARTSTPPERLGTATGLTNVGGFTATLTTIALVGVALDLLTGGASPTLADYKWAFAVQYVVWGAALVGVVRNRRLLRRELADAGTPLDPLPRAVARRWRERSGRAGR